MERLLDWIASATEAAGSKDPVVAFWRGTAAGLLAGMLIVVSM
jgi:hypothetical protein